MEDVNNFSCHTYGEGRTGNGQFVNFTCRPDEVEQVKEFLKKFAQLMFRLPVVLPSVMADGGSIPVMILSNIITLAEVADTLKF